MNGISHGLAVPILIILIVFGVFGGGFYYGTQKQIAQPEQTTKEFRAELLTTSFEGGATERMEYVMRYPENITIQATNENTRITLMNSSSGTNAVMAFSNEEGRGFSAMDMFNERIKKQCSDCAVVPNNISIQNSADLITVTGDGKEWIIFGNYSRPWLVTAEFSSPDQEIEQTISTFTFVK